MAKFTSDEATDPGADIFLRKCSYCHGRNGKGRGEFLPPRAGASSLVATVPDAVMNIILNGAGRVVSDGGPDSYRKPAFSVQLRDEDIAAVASFVRQAWDNNVQPNHGSRGQGSARPHGSVIGLRDRVADAVTSGAVSPS